MRQNGIPLAEEALRGVRENLLRSSTALDAAAIATAVSSTGRFLGTASTLAATDRITADLIGLGALQPLLSDPSITDIYVNSPGSVWTRSDRGLQRSAVAFDGEDQVRALAVRLVAASGRRLDDSNPCLDVRLPGGIRVHAVLPPISAAGTVLSIRVARSVPFSLAELTAAGMLAPGAESLLRGLMRSRLNFLISGATGSGKTTLLNTLIGQCDPSERVVIVEDTAELEPAHEHWLRLESRTANAEHQGGVGLDRLVREALRMNPERLIVGECRGAEVSDLLTALNTGHSGAGTIHANSAKDVPARLLSLGALAGWSPEAVNLQAASALDVVLHVSQGVRGRQLSQICAVAYTGGRLRADPVVDFMPDGGVRLSAAWATFGRVVGVDASEIFGPGLARHAHAAGRRTA